MSLRAPKAKAYGDSSHYQSIRKVGAINFELQAGSRWLYKADNMDPEDIASNECASPCATAILLYVAIINLEATGRDARRTRCQNRGQNRDTQ